MTYGFELLSPDRVPLEDMFMVGLLSVENLGRDIAASLNATEMAKRQFREIARIAGLTFQGYPGSPKTTKQLQVSSGLIYDVFIRYDPDNKLLSQAYREVLERQLEHSRLRQALDRLATHRVTMLDLPRLTPFAFPLVVDHTREMISSEKLSDRIQRMELQLEKAADTSIAKRAAATAKASQQTSKSKSKSSARKNAIPKSTG